MLIKQSQRHFLKLSNKNLFLTKPCRSFDTRCVQAGSVPDSRVGCKLKIKLLINLAIAVPIDLSTLFEKTDTRLPGNGKLYLYTRLGNPTRTALETQLAAIHLTKHALAANSITAAYYALSLLFHNETDEVLTLVNRTVFDFADGPQPFKVIEALNIDEICKFVTENTRIKLVVIDKV